MLYTKTFPEILVILTVQVTSKFFQWNSSCKQQERTSHLHFINIVEVDIEYELILLIKFSVQGTKYVFTGLFYLLVYANILEKKKFIVFNAQKENEEKKVYKNC